MAGAVVVVAVLLLLVWHRSGQPAGPEADSRGHGSPVASTGSPAADRGSPSPPPSTVTLGTPASSRATDGSSVPVRLPLPPARTVLHRPVDGGPTELTMTDSWLVLTQNGDSVRRRGHLLVLPLPDGRALETGQVRFPDGGVVSCPQVVLNEWLLWTEVADQPADNTLTPGPPQAWRLHALDLRTGRQRVLDQGTRDAMANDACAKDLRGDAVWQRPDGLWRRWQPDSDSPVALVPGRGLAGLQAASLDGTLYVRDHDEVESDLVWQRAGSTGLTPVATVPHLSAVALSGDRLLWASSSDGGADVVGTVRACLLPGCDREVRLSDLPAWRVAVGRDFAAWSGGPSGTTLNAATWDGHQLDLPGDPLQNSGSFAMSSTRLATVVVSNNRPTLRVYDLS